MSKAIVFCADGTWNGPGHDDDESLQEHFTNVYKLFLGLEGSMTGDSIRQADEQEKALSDGNKTVQIAKYIHGVGDSRNPVIKLMGGAFGAGIISRIVRGYTFISRNYEPGDNIFIVGFSRGAYTARALAGMICSQGLLTRKLTDDKTEAYRWGAKVWYRFRKQTQSNGNFLVKLTEAVSDLPAFLSSDEIQADSLIGVESIRAVAVWDTVGALGVPVYINDSRADIFRFADTKLSSKVEHGFHALALDEQRVDFVPTFWDQAPNVTQMIFPGAHGDVGGGYPCEGNESGLSDMALGWMVEQLQTAGLRFSSPVFNPYNPDCSGTAHKPWLRPPFNLPGMIQLRKFEGTGALEHSSIQDRINAGSVVAEPGETAAPYEPRNRP
jgi:uncharacterized protein (DUF2235 family)